MRHRHRLAAPTYLRIELRVAGKCAVAHRLGAPLHTGAAATAAKAHVAALAALAAARPGQWLQARAAHEAVGEANSQPAALRLAYLVAFVAHGGHGTAVAVEAEQVGDDAFAVCLL